MSGTAPAVRRVMFGSEITRHRPRNPPKIRIGPEDEALLGPPTWSVRSLLPPRARNVNKTAEGSLSDAEAEITREKLHHLLKLSALPKPKNELEELKMLNMLRDQVHFVKEIQKVDTTGIEPLLAIRDETSESIREQTVTLEDMQMYLDKEEKVGINGTIRRRKPTEMITDSGWDPFELGEGKETRKKGKFFFVKKEPPKPAAN